MAFKLSLQPSATFWIPFSCIFLGYICTNTALQIIYYRDGKKRSLWKSQRDKLQCEIATGWWLPALNLVGRGKPGRHPRHAAFATFNLIMASCFAGMCGHLIALGRSRVYFRCGSETVFDGCLRAFAAFALAVLWQSVLEYYWHRAMHLPALYSRLHKYHHHYKAPQPFDDMFINPLEAFGYYCILYSPPFVLRMHAGSFVGYMALMGACGILDHCGVRLRLPGGLYDSKDHDRHHEFTEVNYGFPFLWMDMVHGTSFSCGGGGGDRSRGSDSGGGGKSSGGGDGGSRKVGDGGSSRGGNGSRKISGSWGGITRTKWF